MPESDERCGEIGSLEALSIEGRAALNRLDGWVVREGCGLLTKSKLGREPMTGDVRDEDEAWRTHRCRCFCCERVNEGIFVGRGLAGAVLDDLALGLCIMQVAEEFRRKFGESDGNPCLHG